MIERWAEWRVAPLCLKEWASPTLDSHAQPSCFYCHLLKLAAHPFTHMSEPAASRNVTGTFVNINNYSACIPKLLTSALPSPPSVRAAMCVCRRKVLQRPCTTMCNSTEKQWHSQIIRFTLERFFSCSSASLCEDLSCEWADETVRPVWPSGNAGRTAGWGGGSERRWK